MTWLFPLYLLGAAAVILPVLLHLRKRPPKERVEFSSLMFLEKSPLLLKRRSKLEQWLLLALRCLALILLALMFARPFLRGRGEQAAEKSGQAFVILVDTSASMRRESLWKQAADEVGKHVASLNARDRVEVIAFDESPRVLWSFAEDEKVTANRAAAITAKLMAESATWRATQMDAALRAATASFQSLANIKTRPAQKTILLISDMQEGARLESLRGFAWPENVSVQVAPLTVKDATNLSLALAAAESEDDYPAKEKSPAGSRVRVTNARDSKSDAFTLRWEKAKGEPITGQIAAGTSRVVRIAREDESATTLLLEGDAHDFDNRVYIAPPQPREAQVLYVGENTSDSEVASPLYYLKRALQPSAQLRPVLKVADDSLATQLTKTDVVFIAGLKDASHVEALAKWMNDGGLLVWTQIGADAGAISKLAGVPLKVSEVPASSYAMLSEVRYEHPLLRPFADARLRDFTKVRFWHHRKIEGVDDTAVIAQFDNGDPAWLALERGKGRLLVLASGWHPTDSQLALSTKFVPLIFGWLEAAGFSHEQSQSYLVGETLPDTQSDGSRIAQQPGIIEIGKGDAKRQVAVNLAPEERRTAPMDAERLAQLGVKLAGRSQGAQAVVTAEERMKLEAADEEARQRGWFLVLILLLAVLVAETFVAGRKRALEEITPPAV
jgi:hypothetical protein